MKLGKAIKKVEKALGVKMQRNGNGTYWAQYGNNVISFFGNGGDEMDNEVTCLHIRRENDHSDPYTDYHAGYFVRNVTQLIHAVKPPEPKFKAGVLVRGKSNKRASRHGFAGKVGLVTKASSTYVHVRWVGESDADIRARYNGSYSQRDLELVSG
tara:strand:- start:1008 stop:1472 length:465 start_codon:yes stop_codon:yes gene_type:complete